LPSFKVKLYRVENESSNKAPSKMGRKMVFGRGGIRTARNSMKDMTFPLKDIEIFTPKQKYL